MEILWVIIGILIMIWLISREKEYFKQYKLYGNVAITYIITVCIIYLTGSSKISRSY